MLDEATVEQIVREVIRRLAEHHPELLAPSLRGENPLVTHHHGRVLTEYDLIKARRAGHRVVAVLRKTLITPLARDRARDMGITIEVRET